MSFHTIKSILNPISYKRMRAETSGFHTIKSILNLGATAGPQYTVQRFHTIKSILNSFFWRFKKWIY